VPFLLITTLTFFCFDYLDAKAGGAPAAVANAAATKYKMRPDEALKILNIEKEGLTKKILDEVRNLMYYFYEIAERPY